MAPLARSGGDDNGDQRRRLSDDAPGASTPPFRCLPVPVGAYAPPHPSWRRSSRRCRTSSRLASSWRALHRQNVEAIGRAGSRQCTWPARNVWAIGQAGSWLLVWPARGATHVSRATHASRDACKATPSHTAPTREWPCQARTREPPTLRARCASSVPAYPFTFTQALLCLVNFALATLVWPCALSLHFRRQLRLRRESQPQQRRQRRQGPHDPMRRAQIGSSSGGGGGSNGGKGAGHAGNGSSSSNGAKGTAAAASSSSSSNAPPPPPRVELFYRRVFVPMLRRRHVSLLLVGCCAALTTGVRLRITASARQNRP